MNNTSDHSEKVNVLHFFGHSLAFGYILRTIAAIAAGRAINISRVTATLPIKLIVKFPVTIGRSRSSDSEIKILVIVKPVKANPILPFRNAITTGAAVAVGVMPTKNAAFASSSFSGHANRIIP